MKKANFSEMLPWQFLAIGAIFSSMSKEFNPNDIGIANGNYFGLPYSLEESQLLLYSVPWDVTTSYGGGASHGPQAMLSTSLQVDLFDFDVPDAWALVQVQVHKRRGTKG